jgi:hypothetical protein
MISAAHSATPVSSTPAMVSPPVSGPTFFRTRPAPAGTTVAVIWAGRRAGRPALTASA